MPRALNKVLVVTFLAILLAPTAALVFGLDPMNGLDEKRALARKPPARRWTLAAVPQMATLAQEWEKYFNDHFGLRKLLIGSYRLATFYLLKASPNPGIVVGQSDRAGRWLFLDADVTKDGFGFEGWLGKKPYTNAELSMIAVQLKQAVDLAQRNGVKFMIVVCPDKHTVYPENLPGRFRAQPGTRSRLDQFWEMAAGLKDVPMVDLRVPLWNAKQGATLYHTTDTHWNFRGGFVGYQVIAKALQAQDPSREPIASAFVQWQDAGQHAGDLVKLMGLTRPLQDQGWTPIVAPEAVQGKPKHGKLLVLGDSFFEAMRPFFEMQFQTVKKLNRARHPDALFFTQELLDVEKPDVVIIESVERYWVQLN
jgi:hypothetical protein